MMRRILLALLLALVPIAGAGQTIPPGPFGPRLGGLGPICPGTGAICQSVPSYVGPGDIVPGALAWYGLRAYSGSKASAHAAAVRLVRASDSTQQDIALLGSGALDTASASTFCNATTCKVVTLYDQSGNSVDITQATDANRPAFTFSCLGSLPCITFNGAHPDHLEKAAGVPTTAQPWSVVGAAQRTSGITFAAIIDTEGADSYGLAFGNAANLVGCFSGNGPTATANDSVWHAVQCTANGASSTIVVDGSSSTINAGANPLFNGRIITGDNQFAQALTGTEVEMGFWPSGFSAGNFTSMNTNIHTYWGF